MRIMQIHYQKNTPKYITRHINNYSDESTKEDSDEEKSDEESLNKEYIYIYIFKNKLKIF